MPIITVNDETYAHLQRLAEVRGTTVEEVTLPEAALAPLPDLNEHASPAEIERRLRGFAEVLRLTRELTAHLPAGHVVDDSREAIYEGCGE